MIGGSPCDQFSVVNRQRKGLAGKHDNDAQQVNTDGSSLVSADQF